MVSTYRLLSRLVIERTIHRMPFDADSLAHQCLLVEDELERCYPVRWPRLRSALLLEQATWWSETHDGDLFGCQVCWYASEVERDQRGMPGRQRPPTLN
jgi:hypothetical protein